LNQKKTKLLHTKKTTDMNEKKKYMKVNINVRSRTNMKKSIEVNMTMAMNMNEQEFHEECQEECQEEVEGECDVANGNEMLLNCLLPRRPNPSGGGRHRYPARLPKISRQKYTVRYFGSDSCRCSPAR
jgi:protein subunit release factor A